MVGIVPTGGKPKSGRDRAWRLAPGLLACAAVTLPTVAGAFEAGPPAAATAGSADVVRYGPEFFADKDPKTALDMVNLLPGFTLSIGDTTVRGYTGAVGNALIDGRRPADIQFGLDQVLQRIPADDVDHVEVVRGVAPGIEMLGQTVVANVVLKTKAARDILTATASFAAFTDGRNAPSITLETTRHNGEGRSFTGAVSVMKYVELADGDGLQVRRDAAGGVLGRLGVNSAADGYTSYAYGLLTTPFQAGKLSVSGSVNRTDYSYRETDTTASSASDVVHLREYLGGPLGGQLSGEIGAHYDRSVGRRWSSDSVLLVHLKDQSYKSVLDQAGADELFAEHDRGGEALGRSNWRYVAPHSLSAEFSLEGAYNWLHTNSLFTYGAVPVALPNAQATVSETRGEAAAQAVWSISRTWRLEVGARLETSTISSRADAGQRKRLTYPKPRAVLTITPDAKTQIRLRVEREVGQLDFTNFVASSTLDTGSIHAGNTDITPQQSWTFEATWERRFWSDGALSLTLRRSRLSDAIDRVPVRDPSNPAASFDAPGNIGGGVEDALLVNLTVALDRVGLAHGQLKANGLFQHSQVTDPTTGRARPITGRDPGEYAVSFRQNLPAARAAWGASLATACATSSTAKGCTTTDYRFNEIDAYRAEPTLNVFFERQLRADTLLRLEADNILRAGYERVVQAWNGPRDLFPLAYSDTRRLTSSASLLVSLRRTF